MVGTVLFYFWGKDFLLVIDYYSKYVEVTCLKEELSVTTIKALKNCFVRWGIPEEVRSHGGPQ